MLHNNGLLDLRELPTNDDHNASFYRKVERLLTDFTKEWGYDTPTHYFQQAPTKFWSINKMLNIIANFRFTDLLPSARVMLRCARRQGQGCTIGELHVFCKRKLAQGLVPKVPY